MVPLRRMQAPPFHVRSCFFFLLLLAVELSWSGEATPVVGILSEPIYTEQNTTEYMIAASYVKWLEVGGARSIPIPYDATPNDIENIFPKINGVLFPGGGGKLLPPAARHLWRMAAVENQDGFFPIFGTCLGFEYLLMLASGKDDILEGGFEAENISLPLELLRESQLYQGGLRNIVVENNITMNNHHFGITPDKLMRNSGLSSMFDITAVSQDQTGRRFVSTIEPKSPDSTPYYGVQYHPEKNAFEYATYPGTNVPYEAIDHSPEGVWLAAHLARFFVNLTATNMARRSPRAAAASSDDLAPVYSYPRKVGIKFQEYYIIPPAKSKEAVWRSEAL